MADVIVQFTGAVAAPDGRAYTARVCGRPAPDGLWEGWIEFDPHDGTPVLRTPRETEQPNRMDLEYWATGLTVTYLEGALERARHPEVPSLRPATIEATPAYDRPASPRADGGAPAAPGADTRAILDPFAVHAQGEDLLREELSALDEGHLRNIVRAYDLVDEGDLDLQTLTRPTLVEMITSAVRRRTGR